MVLDPMYADVIRRRLEIPLSEGPDKVTTLEGALRRLVKPGMTPHLGTAHARANVHVRELVRQWWGTAPAFTLAAVGLGSPWGGGVPRGRGQRGGTPVFWGGGPL